jgi:hypothetical protein
VPVRHLTRAVNLVGTGREVGRVYRLDDGRTIIVKPRGQRSPAGG